MDTRKIAAEYRLSQWGQLIGERQSSGECIRDFCKRNQIAENQYYYWQQKLRKASCAHILASENKTNIVPVGFVKLVDSNNDVETKDLTIDISGYKITVNNQTDLNLLSKVCQALRSL